LTFRSYAEVLEVLIVELQVRQEVPASCGYLSVGLYDLVCGLIDVNAHDALSELGGRVVVTLPLFGKNLPVMDRDPVPCFAMIQRGEVERSV
jgi:hypothetical protein